MSATMIYTRLHRERSTIPARMELLFVPEYEMYTPTIDALAPRGKILVTVPVTELSRELGCEGGAFLVKGLADYHGPSAYYNEVAIYDSENRLIMIGTHQRPNVLTYGVSKITAELGLSEVVSINAVELPRNRFKVSVAEYRESSGSSWVVVLINENLPHDPFGGERKNPGYITPFISKIKEQADHEAQAWARFLGVQPPVKCTCVMCDVPKWKEDR